MSWVAPFIAFVVGAVSTWLLTVHRVARPIRGGGHAGSEASAGAPVSSGSVAPASSATPDPEAARFAGTPTAAAVDTHGAGARWIPRAEDEDALLHPREHPSPPASGGTDPARAPVDRDGGSR